MKFEEKLFSQKIIMIKSITLHHTSPFMDREEQELCKHETPQFFHW